MADINERPLLIDQSEHPNGRNGERELTGGLPVQRASPNWAQESVSQEPAQRKTPTKRPLWSSIMTQ
jgi:hypothetical protein